MTNRFLSVKDLSELFNLKESWIYDRTSGSGPEVIVALDAAYNPARWLTRNSQDAERHQTHPIDWLISVSVRTTLRNVNSCSSVIIERFRSARRKSTST